MNEMSRRQFAARAAYTFLGVSMWPMLTPKSAAAAATGKAKNVIYLYMSGGMSHLDTFDPKPGTPEQGPMGVINTNVSGIRLGEHLKGMAKQMDKVAVVNSLRSTTGAHEQGQYMMHTSYAMRGTIIHPGMGSWLLALDGRHNPVLPGNVIIGGSSSQATSGFLESKYAPLPIGGARDGLPYGKVPFSEKDFYDRLSLADAYDKPFRHHYDQKQIRAYTNLYSDAIKLMNSKDTEVFDIMKEPEAMRTAYGNNGFGQGCLLARRLVEQQVRFVEVNLGGWDTHTDNFDALEDRVPVLDQAMSTLLSDLQSRGLLDSTLVVLATEFGRSPHINGSMGRDHHPKAFSGLLAGGGIKGGQVYGKTTSNGFDVEDKECRIPDFNATIAAALGLPLDKVVKSPSGRPFTVADKGKPLDGLL
ncbi:MAG: DUF1501 domain-containing protein [Planctomycetes bacterium]|nr:DUF1501 domain-containing protein [Planctomycetota bacterium]